MTAAAWLQAHAAAARQVLDLSIAGLVGLHTKTPWAFYRRAAVGAFVALKGAHTAMTRNYTILASLIALASFAATTARIEKGADDEATKREKVLDAAQATAVAAIAQAFNQDPTEFGQLANRQLLGVIYDGTELAVHELEAVIDKSPAPPALTPPADGEPAGGEALIEQSA